MSQLFARVFLPILDSSIAEDFTLRHIFEDFLKLVDHRNGTVDMTREAISRRLNVPLEILNKCIDRLESPDPKSRNAKHEGRRLLRLDDHRDWGWQLTNWEEYDSIRNRADLAERVGRHRQKKADDEQPPDDSEQKPSKARGSLEEIKTFCLVELGVPSSDAEWFFFKCEANGWHNGGKPIKDWQLVLRSWKAGKYLPSQKGNNGSGNSNPNQRRSPSEERNHFAGVDAAERGRQTVATIERRKQAQLNLAGQVAQAGAQPPAN